MKYCSCVVCVCKLCISCFYRARRFDFWERRLLYSGLYLILCIIFRWCHGNVILHDLVAKWLPRGITSAQTSSMQFNDDWLCEYVYQRIRTSQWKEYVQGSTKKNKTKTGPWKISENIGFPKACDVRWSCSFLIYELKRRKMHSNHGKAFVGDLVSLDLENVPSIKKSAFSSLYGSFGARIIKY